MYEAAKRWYDLFFEEGWRIEHSSGTDYVLSSPKGYVFSSRALSSRTPAAKGSFAVIDPVAMREANKAVTLIKICNMLYNDSSKKNSSTNPSA